MASLTWLEPGVLWRQPLDLRHDSLEPRLVLTAKVVACCWVVTGLVSNFPAVHAPWVPWLEAAPAVWPQLLIGASLLAALGLLFTPFVRAAAFAQAAVIVLGLLSSRAAFGYHRLFVACFFLAVSAAGPGFRAKLPRWQVAVLYLGAGLDKAGNAAWRDGSFISSLVRELATFGRLWGPGGHVGEPNAVAQALASVLSTFPGLAMVLGLTVIALELFLAVAFALEWPGAAWGSVVLQTGILLITGGTLGVFVHVGLAMGLLVVRAPRSGPVLLMAVLLSLPLFSPLPALLILAVGLAAIARGARAESRRG